MNARIAALALLAALSIQAEARAATSARLVCEWKFEDTLEDTSGNENHGTAPTFPDFVDGKFGRAVALTRDNVVENTVATGLPLTGASSWSMNLWVNLPEEPESLAYIAGFGPVLSTGAGTARSFLAFTGAAARNIYIWGNSRDVGTGNAYPINRWAMLTATHDGGNGITIVYLDGAEIGRGVQTLADVPADQNRITLAPVSNWSKDLQGAFDELTIWEGVLSQADILQLAGIASVAINVEPKDVTRYPGEAAQFSVVAAGEPPLAYQWRKDGAVVLDATNSLLSFGHVSAAIAGDYTVVVSNAGGSVTSAPAALVVLPVDNIETALAGYWAFDEGSGLTAVDASGNGNDGQLNNFAGDDTQWVSGQVGGALNFRGPTGQDWVYVADYPKASNTFTLSAWVWVEARTAWGSIMKNWGNTQRGQFHFGLNASDGDLSHYLDTGSDVQVGVRAGAAKALPLNTWQHAAVVGDGATVRLYHNGMEVGSVPYDGTLINPPAMTSLSIGCKTDTSGLVPDTASSGFWQGKMDDLGMWGRALSPAEVLAVYVAGLNGQPLTAADAFMTAPPTISQPPQAATCYAGEAVRLSIAAAGTAPLAYLWFKDGASVADATNNVLGFDHASGAAAGEYTVVVSNSGGSVTSAPAAIVVLPIENITTALAGYWPFDETYGLGTADASGNGNDGQLVNFVDDGSEWVAGQVGGALNFRGPEGLDYVMIPNYPKPASTMTLAAWVWADARTTWASVAKNWSGSGNQFHFGLNDADGDLSNYLTQQNGVSAGPVREGANTPFPLGAWQHVAFVCDGAQMRLYRNGALVGSVPYDGTINTNLASEAMGIGAKLLDTGIPPVTADSGYWQGKMDDFGLWTRGLTPDEILAIYAAGRNGQPLTAAVVGAVAPTITTGPQDQTQPEDGTAEWTVTAAGTTPLRYQWRKDGVDLPGATNATLKISYLCANDAGAYDVEVCNVAGCVTSEPAATLTITTPVPLTEGLTGYWNFDETSGAMAVDSSGSGNDGQLNNFPVDGSQWVPGQVGGALNFRGPAGLDWVLVSDYPKPTDKMTVALWVWANSRPTWASFVKNWGSSSSGQFHFGLNAGDGDISNYLVQQGGTTAGPAREGASNPFPLGSWQHVAFVCDGTRMRLYRNGVEIGSVAYDGTIRPDPIMTSLSIGCKTDNTGLTPDAASPGYWDGKMDEVAIWSRGLSVNEIGTLYAAGLQGRALDAAAAAPQLRVSYSTGTVTVSWPVSGRCFALESTASLAPDSWTAVTQAPNVRDDRCVITISAAGGNRFFRLKKP